MKKNSGLLASLLLAAALLASACSGNTLDESALVVARPAVVQTTTTTSTTTSTTSTSTTSTTTTVPAPLPYETWVAVATESISVLQTFAEPDGEPIRFEFDLYNPTYWETPLALRITEGTGRDEWVKVALPVRPNGSEAWIQTDGFEISSHTIHAEIVLSERAVRVFDGEELLTETAAVVGKESSPTPVGKFYVNDLLPRDNPDGVFGPYILSLSAFSEALDTFGGGLPVIAIHGTNRADLIGGQHSNGCIRIPNDVVTFLAENVPLGTPVDISA